jgi:putative flippase GtrA
MRLALQFPTSWIQDRSIARYLLVGVLNTSVSLGVIYVAMDLAGINYAVANLIGYALGVLMSFFLNKYWTFNERSSKSVAQFGRFVLVVLVAYCCNLATVALLIPAFAHRRILAQALGVIPYTAIGYLGSRFFVFRQASTRPLNPRQDEQGHLWTTNSTLEATTPSGTSTTIYDPSRLARAQTVFFWGLVIVVAAYMALGYALSNSPLQDLPNHLARAHIISQLLYSPAVSSPSLYSLNLSFSPYLLGDLILASLDHFFGATGAARIWIISSIVALPSASYFLLRSLKCPKLNVLTGCVLSLYIATDWPFTMGFMNYQFAMAGALAAYASAIRAINSGRSKFYWLYALLVAATYAMHLSGLVFCIVMVFFSVAEALWQRRIQISRATVLMGIPLVLLIVDRALTSTSTASEYSSGWGTLSTKVLRIVSPGIRFDIIPEFILFMSFCVIITLPIVFSRRQWVSHGRPLIASAIAFLALYFILPSNTGNIYAVDVRALPYAFLFLAFSGLVCPLTSTLNRSHYLLSVGCAAVNLIFLCHYMLPANAAIAEYRKLILKIPVNSSVLPIDTRPAVGRYRPFVHAGSYVSLDDGGLTPYLFAADLNPPMSYFRYANGRPYAPDGFWYSESTDNPDWSTIKLTYQYILITNPWNAARVPLRYDIVGENNVATLLKVAP